MAHRPVTVEIRAAGYTSTSGGFTTIWINKIKHHPNDVARMVECHVDILAALKGFVSACGGNPPDWLKGEFAVAEDAIAKAEGRAVPAFEPDPYETAARAAGWDHGGDCGGIIFHKETWGSWKAAVSWSGTDNEPAGNDAKPATYSTWRECCEGEGIEVEGRAC